MHFYSVIIPLFNEEEVFNESYKRLKNVMDSLNEDYELIFINDGSTDTTETLVKNTAILDKKVKLINFSRNFGHQIAISAGMDYSSGDAVIIIDADLQDPPELIPKMISKYIEGYDVVYAVRSKRKGETFFKKFSAKLFYRTLKYLTDFNIPVDTGDFRLISRNVCDVLSSLDERNRFVRGLVSWVGFNQIGIEYVRDDRFAGETKYPLKKMLKLSMDGITSFSVKPLKLSIVLGAIIMIIDFLYCIYLIINKLLFNSNIIIHGWTSTLIITAFLSGIQLLMLGIIGEYLARIFEESKNRPLYIVKEVINLDKKIKK